MQMTKLKTIYLDSAATTPLLPSVKEVMTEAMEMYANPATVYGIGQEAKKAVENARAEIAHYVGCNPSEIVFTSGGSESDNTALISVYDKLHSNIVTSQIEHKAILNTCHYLEEFRGANVTYLCVDSNGIIDLHELRSSLTANTLVSVMHVNNEIGSVQPMESISAIAHEHGALFHTDNVQGFCHRNLDINLVDLMSVSAHKIGGPKGVGFLYVKDGIELPPYIHGGQQESGRRAGTTNVPGILGTAEAVKQWAEYGKEWNKYEASLSLHLRNRLLSEIPGIRLNGPEFPRAYNNTNVSIAGIRGEELLVLLDILGICVSTGSACNSEDHSPSHVLKAIGLTDDEADGSLRITVSHENTMEEIDFVVDRIKVAVGQLRGE